MKRKKTPKITSEEVLRRAAESRLGLDFDYDQIRERVDAEGIVRRRAARCRESLPFRAYRRPSVAVFLTTFILCATLGAGGMMIAHWAGEPTPPPVDPVGSEDGGESTHVVQHPGDETGNSETSSADDPQFHRQDVLTWEGNTYVRTDILLPASQVKEKLGEVVPAGPLSGSEPSDRFQGGKAVATSLDEGTSFYIVSNVDYTRGVAVQIPEGFAFYMIMPAEETQD